MAPILFFLVVLIGGNVVVFRTIGIMSSGGESVMVDNFQITDAFFYKDNTTSLTLNYYGTEPVYVSIHIEQWLYGGWQSMTIHIGTMQQGDEEEFDFMGYVTCMGVIYNNKEVRLEWKPVLR